MLSTAPVWCRVASITCRSGAGAAGGVSPCALPATTHTLTSQATGHAQAPRRTPPPRCTPELLLLLYLRCRALHRGRCKAQVADDPHLHAVARQHVPLLRTTRGGGGQRGPPASCWGLRLRPPPRPPSLVQRAPPPPTSSMCASFCSARPMSVATSSPLRR